MAKPRHERTEEHRRKLSEAMKAYLREHPEFRRRYRHSEETRRRIGDSFRGMKRGALSSEHKRKIGAALRGRRLSAEHLAKLGKAARERAGAKASMYGRTYSRATIRKMSEARKRCWG